MRPSGEPTGYKRKTLLRRKARKLADNKRPAADTEAQVPPGDKKPSDQDQISIQQ
jgi:hypothetical protein